MANSHYTVKFRTSMPSQCKFSKKSRLYGSNNNTFMTTSSYSGIPCPSRNYDSIKQADVERASKLRAYQLSTTDQNAQKQRPVLANEITFKKFRTKALIAKRKAELAAEMKIESERRKLKLTNKWIEIETQQRIV